MGKDAREAILRLYEADVWGDSILHPGGMALTERVARLVDLREDSRVLDVASGKGQTASYLAQVCGCHVVGVDVSRGLVHQARHRANASHIEHLLAFLVGDAEILPFCDGCFDILLCECSFSLLPRKDVAAKEFYRVLRRGGRIGIADFHIRVSSSSFKNELPFLRLDGTETQGTYQTLMHKSGFHTITFEDHTEKLKEFFLDLMLSFGSISAFLDKLSLDYCNRECGAGASADIEKGLRDGTIGYCVVTGTK